MKNWNQYREIPVDCMQPVMCVFVLIFMIIFLTTGFSEQGFPRIFTGLNYYTGSSLQLLQGMGLQWRCFHGEIVVRPLRCGQNLPPLVGIELRCLKIQVPPGRTGCPSRYIPGLARWVGKTSKTGKTVFLLKFFTVVEIQVLQRPSVEFSVKCFLLDLHISNSI